MFTDIISKFATARTSMLQQSRPAHAPTACTMEPMEDRLLMAIVAVNCAGNTPIGDVDPAPTRDPTAYAVLITR